MKAQSFVKQLVARFALCLNAIAIAACGGAFASTRTETPTQTNSSTQEEAPMKETKKKEETCEKRDLQKELAQLSELNVIHADQPAALYRPYGAPVPQSDYCERNQKIEKLAEFTKTRLGTTDGEANTIEPKAFKKELQESIDSLNALGIINVSTTWSSGRCYSYACGEDVEHLSDLKALVSYAQKL